MRHLNIAALAITAVLSVSALGGSASAMPLSGLASVATQRADTVSMCAWCAARIVAGGVPARIGAARIGGRTMAIGAGTGGAGAAGAGTAIGANRGPGLLPRA
jgi:hypothetical protein